MSPIIVACFWNVVINFLLTQFLFCRESTTACWDHIISSNFFCKHKIFEWLKSLDCSLLPSAYDIHSVVDSVTNNEFIFLRHSDTLMFMHFLTVPLLPKPSLQQTWHKETAQTFCSLPWCLLLIVWIPFFHWFSPDLWPIFTPEQTEGHLDVAFPSRVTQTLLSI